MNIHATPDNTAVVTILAYEKPGLVPVTANFMLASAAKFGIKVFPFLKGDIYHFVEKPIYNSYENKVVKLRPCIEQLPWDFEYVLFVDSRDVLFVRPLDVICSEFNKIGWPFLMSSTNTCRHHFDAGWQARFPKHASGFDYNNAGVWMAERETLMNAFDILSELSKLVQADKIHSSFPPLFNNDQHLWQVAYLEHAFPMRLDFDQVIFNSFHKTEFSQYDYPRSENDKPIALKNGSFPSILHFAGDASIAMPYVAWLTQIVKPGETPQLEW